MAGDAHMFSTSEVVINRLRDLTVRQFMHYAIILPMCTVMQILLIWFLILFQNIHVIIRISEPSKQYRFLFDHVWQVTSIRGPF